MRLDAEADLMIALEAIKNELAQLLPEVQSIESYNRRVEDKIIRNKSQTGKIYRDIRFQSEHIDEGRVSARKLAD